MYKGRLIDLGLEQVAFPDGRTIELEIVRHPGGAVICAVDDRGLVCLLRQFRYATGEGTIWELPAGCIDPEDRTPVDTARRELREEAGVDADSWLQLGPIYPSPGFCDEILHLFLARDLKSVPRAPQDDELIEVHWLDLDEAVAMALDGRIRDAKSVIGLLRGRHILTGHDREIQAGV